jgi:MFS family permease
MMHGMQLIVGISTPALGGFLAAYVDLRLPFYLSGAGTGLFAIWALFRLPETRPRHLVDAGMGTDSRRTLGAFFLLRDPSFLAVCLLAFSTFFLRGGATTGLIPAYLLDVLSYDEATLGVLFTAASVIHGAIVYPSGWASDKWGRKPIIVPVGVVVGAGLVVIPFMESIVPFTIVFLILHTAIGWGGQAPTAYLGDISPAGQRGNAFGMYRTFGDLAGIFGPIVALGLADAFNYVVAFTFGAVLWMASIAFFMKVAKESSGPKRMHPTALAERSQAGRQGH